MGEEEEGALVEYGAMEQRPRLEDVPKLTARQIVWALFMTMLKGPGNMASEAVAMYSGFGAYDPAQRLRHSQLEFIIDILEGLQERFDRLERELEEEEMPNAAEAAAIFEHAIGAARVNTSRDKRRLIQNALLNAFDPELYREGMVVRMFELLGGLEYPELHLLHDIGSKMKRGMAKQDSRAALSTMTKNPLFHHHKERLESLRLISGSYIDLKATSLGHYLLRFISEPDIPDTSTGQEAGSASNG